MNEQIETLIVNSRLAFVQGKYEETFVGIEKAKKNLSGRKTTLNSDITSSNGELATVKSNITRYDSLISEADSTMRTASVDMAYHKKYMTA
jgi:hypothetical protein